jgi:uncharacterized OB-fold protein
MGTVIEPVTGKIVGWRDTIRLRYEYTAGIAGETFLRALKDGRILASKCARCGEVRIPPRIYCLECGGRTRIDVQVVHLGWVGAVSTTIGSARLRGRREGKGAESADSAAARERPPGDSQATFGYIKFAGVSGGLVHRLLRASKGIPRPGEEVGPIFVPQRDRKGSILDIEGFRAPAR